MWNVRFSGPLQYPWINWGSTFYFLRLESGQLYTVMSRLFHDDVIKWKHFPHCWLFVRGIHWSPVNSPHRGQWRGALMFSLICA